MRVLVPAAICLFFGITSFAAEPFKMELKYIYEGRLLQIDLERLSRDEVEHFMQKIIIYQNGESRQEETMINQNHLNHITKYIPFFAKDGDEITIELHYGNKLTYAKNVRVQKPDQMLELLSSENYKKQGSFLIKDKAVSAPNTKSEKTEAGSPRSAVKEAPSYGYKDFGYEGGKAAYGYTKEESEYYNKIYGHDPYSYKPKREEKGYEDPGNVDVGQAGYGKEGLGYEGEKTSYGRESYEN